MGEKITIGRVKTFNHIGAKNFNYLHTVVKDNLSKLAACVSIETKDSDIKIFWKTTCYACCCIKSFSFRFRFN